MIINAPRALLLAAMLAPAFALGAQAKPTKQAPAPATPSAPKEQPPAAAPAKDFRVPAHRTFALSNGMKVTFIPFGTVPKVTMDLELRTGVIDEGRNDVTLASVIGDMLLEGTTTRSALDISRQAAEMGGSINSSWGSERSAVGGEVLSDFGAAFVGLMADVVLHPKFDSADFKRVIDKHARDNAISLAQADALVMKKFREVMYGDHPFAHVYPTEDMLRGFTATRARDFHAKNYTAAGAHLYVSGVFDQKAVEKAVRDGFSAWAAGAPPTDHPPTIAVGQQVALVDRPHSVQSALIMGVPAATVSGSDWVKMNVTDGLLGGAFGSRITANIREDKGYTYSPYSMLQARRGATIWGEAADVTTNVTGASITEIFKEIDRLRAEAPPVPELKGIEQNMAGLFTIQNSSRGGLIGQLGFMDLHGLDDTFLTSYVKNVMAVTPEDVKTTAEKYLVPGKFSVVIVGDKAQVEPQLGKVKQLEAGKAKP